MVLKALGTVFRGSDASPAIIEIYSGPPIQKPAVLTALMNDSRRVEGESPAQGPGSFQYLKPKRLLRKKVSGIGQVNGVGCVAWLYCLLFQGVPPYHCDECVQDEAYS